jgi:5-methylcytosine-specific restriction protein B
MSFTWLPLYSEIARKVLEFEDRQSELLGLLAKLTAEGLKVIALTDKDASGTVVPLTAIDPFTFFASFNRTNSVSGRQAILRKIKEAWQLTAAVPEDFDGIPIISAQNSWAFSYLGNRKPNDIPTLWRTAKEGVGKDWRAFDRDLFNKALNVRQMGLSRLTMSLFWLNPRGFLSFDQNTEAFFKGRDVILEGKTAAGYFAWLEKVVATVGNDFPQISLDAYDAPAEEDTTEDQGHFQKTEAHHSIQFWVEKTYVDGRPDRNDGQTAFGVALWSPQAGSDGRDTYRLMREVKPGDLVFHFVDGKEIVGVSRVASELDDTFIVPAGTLWPAGKPAYLIQLTDYSKLTSPLARSEFLENPLYRRQLSDLLRNQESLFFNVKLELNQGAYLTRAPVQLVKIWDELYHQKTGERLPLINPNLFSALPNVAGEVGARADKVNQKTRSERVPFSKADALKDLFMAEVDFDVILARLKRKKAIILQGPPGVGKTFIASRVAYVIMGERDDRRVTMVQFHPSYGYEDFVQGYRPTQAGLERRNGVFYEFARAARNDPERDWFFIIDEINRGNLAKIFGELLMLLEADKRGSQHAIPLMYSEKDETFDFPANLYVIGTMNTADRSLAMVDYALRRRFAFAMLDPAFGSPAFAAWFKGRGASEELYFQIRDRLEELNEAIEKERDLGAGFRIGHSFFCPPNNDAPDDAWYREVVESEIRPLLEEYFDSRERVRELVSRLLAPGL